ncbi:hypothetical protein U1Q18_010666, partial [Sarracenia purpurea var. burkii]
VILKLRSALKNQEQDLDHMSSSRCDHVSSQGSFPNVEHNPNSWHCRWDNKSERAVTQKIKVTLVLVKVQE